MIGTIAFIRLPMQAYVYSDVSKLHGDIHNCVNNIYSSVNSRGRRTRLVALVLSGVLAAAGAPLAAKERPPEPIANPGECPIDAPLRVASIDSLRRFEGLIAHCPETMVIESPAFRINRPKVDARIRDREQSQPSYLEPPADAPSGSVVIAAARPEPVPTLAAGSTAAQPRGAMVEYVAIVPPAAAFAPDSAAAAVPIGAETQPEVEAILALRPQSYATSFDEKIAHAARTHRVDPLLLHAVIKQESGYRQRAVSHAGARGLMQVMPATGRSLGVADPGSLFDAEVNIAAGAKLLSSLWHRFDGNVDLVLAAYNAGEGAVVKHGMKVPPYRETRDYVAKVKANYRSLASESGIAVPF